MQADSRQVSTNQQYLHPKLAAVVHRHLRNRHRLVIPQHNIQAYQQVSTALARQPRPLVLDSFCGTGHSTAALAHRHPGHLVIGVDKSARRLARHVETQSDNYLLLQADCEAIWQLLVADGLVVDYHYMLYPNPWPKAAHLQRRVHGNASFPLIFRLGGQIELRSNWQIYVEEFGLASFLAGYSGAIHQLDASEPALSLFELKYQRSGHQLWAYQGRIIP